MKITLIGANIVTQKGDFFGSGIPYFPLVIAYTASYLREKGYAITLIDAFGENPFQVVQEGNKYIQGLTPRQVLDKIPSNTSLICIGAERVVAHESIIAIIRAIKGFSQYNNIPVVILENTQAVTAYSLQTVAETFFKESVDYVLTGEPELRTEALLHALAETDSKKKQNLLAAVDGLIYRNSTGKTLHNEKKEVIQNPDILPFPAWDLFNLDNYWKLEYAHAPLSTKKYLPLLTSRGCPYPCTFCVVPDTNKQRWRPRSAQHVVDEMETFSKKYGVSEFHLEDLNPTIKKERMVAISQEILRRNLSVTWKIASGTKVETLDEETIAWMAKAGCSYISISPESGSERIMKLMKKPFPYDRALELVHAMHQNNITTQACFILGYPGEQKEDIALTNKYIRQIVKAGIDEIAVLILTPTPGSVIFNNYAQENALDDISKLTFTPTWRKDYKKYALERLRSYSFFVFWRLVYHPLAVVKQPFSFIHKHFYTKMEMTLYRVFRVWLIFTFGKKYVEQQKISEKVCS